MAAPAAAPALEIAAEPLRSISLQQLRRRVSNASQTIQFTSRMRVSKPPELSITCAAKVREWVTFAKLALLSFFHKTDIFFALCSLVYLVFVIGDLVADEVLPTGTCMLVNGSAVEDNEALETKAALVVRIDLGFLVFFFVESVLRACAQGWGDYMRDPINSIDFTVLVVSLALDVYGVADSGAASFGFIRLVRLVRLVRIFATYKRVASRRKKYKKRRLLGVSGDAAVPRCTNWKSSLQSPKHGGGHGRRGSGAGVEAQTSANAASPSSPGARKPRFACFLSHAKQDAGDAARYEQTRRCSS